MAAAAAAAAVKPCHLGREARDGPGQDYAYGPPATRVVLYGGHVPVAAFSRTRSCLSPAGPEPASRQGEFRVSESGPG